MSSLGDAASSIAVDSQQQVREAFQSPGENNVESQAFTTAHRLVESFKRNLGEPSEHGSDIDVIFDAMSPREFSGVLKVLSGPVNFRPTVPGPSSLNADGQRPPPSHFFRVALFKVLLTASHSFVDIVCAGIRAVLDRHASSREAALLVSEISLAVSEFVTTQQLDASSPSKRNGRAVRAKRQKQTTQVANMAETVCSSVVIILRSHPLQRRRKPLSADDIVVLDLLPSLFYFLRNNQQPSRRTGGQRSPVRSPTTSGGVESIAELGEHCIGSMLWARTLLKTLLAVHWPPSMLLPMVNFFVDAGNELVGPHLHSLLRRKVVFELGRSSGDPNLNENLAGLARATLLFAEQHGAESEWFLVTRHIMRVVPRSCWANVVYVVHMAFQQSLSLSWQCVAVFEDILAGQNEDTWQSGGRGDVPNVSKKQQGQLSIAQEGNHMPRKRPQAPQSRTPDSSETLSPHSMSKYELMRMKRISGNKEVLRQLFSNTATDSSEPTAPGSGTAGNLNVSDLEGTRSPDFDGDIAGTDRKIDWESDLPASLLHEDLCWQDVAMALLTIRTGGSFGDGRKESALGHLLLDDSQSRVHRNRALRLATALLIHQAGMRVSSTWRPCNHKVVLSENPKSEPSTEPVTFREVPRSELRLPAGHLVVKQFCHVLAHGGGSLSVESGGDATGSAQYDGASLAYVPALLELAMSWCDTDVVGVDSAKKLGPQPRASTTGIAKHSSDFARGYSLPGFSLRWLWRRRRRPSRVSLSHGGGSVSQAAATSDVHRPNPAASAPGVLHRSPPTNKRSLRNKFPQADGIVCLINIPWSFTASLGAQLFVLLFGAYPSARVRILGTLFGRIASALRVAMQSSGTSSWDLLGAAQRADFGNLLAVLGSAPTPKSRRTSTSPSSVGRHCQNYVNVLRLLCRDWRLLGIVHRNHAVLVNEWLEQLLASSSELSTLSAPKSSRSQDALHHLGRRRSSKSRRTTSSDGNLRQALDSELQTAGTTALLAVVYVLRPLLAVNSVSCGCVFSVARKLSGGQSLALRVRAVRIVACLLVDQCLLPRSQRAEAAGILLLALRLASSLVLRTLVIENIIWVVQSYLSNQMLELVSKVPNSSSVPRVRDTSTSSSSHSAKVSARSSFADSATPQQPDDLQDEASLVLLKGLHSRFVPCLTTASGPAMSAPRNTSKRAISSIQSISILLCLQRVLAEQHGPAKIRHKTVRKKAGKHTVKIQEHPARLLQALLFTSNALCTSSHAVGGGKALAPAHADGSGISVARIFSQLTAVCCSSAFQLAHPEYAFALMLKLQSRTQPDQATIRTQFEATQSDESISEEEWQDELATSTRPQPMTESLSSSPLNISSSNPDSDLGGLAGFASQILKDDEAAAEAAVAADLDPAVKESDIILPIRWRVTLPIFIPLIELAVREGMLPSANEDMNAVATRLGLEHRHDLALRLLEHLALFEEILPAQSHWRSIDSWTPDAKRAAQSAVLTGLRSGRGSSGGRVDPSSCVGIDLKISKGLVHTALTWETALAFFERFLFLPAPTVTALRSSTRPSLLCARSAVNSLLAAAHSWVAEPMLAWARDQTRQTKETLLKEGGSNWLRIQHRFQTSASSLLGSVVTGIANSFHAFYLRCPEIASVSDGHTPHPVGDDEHQVPACVASQVVECGGEANGAEYSGLRTSKWWRTVSQLDVQAVWFDLMEALFLLSNFLISNTIPKFVSSSNVQGAVERAIAKVPLYGLQESSSMRVKPAESIRQYLDRTRGVRVGSSSSSQSSDPNEFFFGNVDLLAVFVAVQAASEIETAGVTILFITRTLSFLRSLEPLFRGSLEISKRAGSGHTDSPEHGSRSLSVLPTRHVVASAFYGVLCRVRIAQVQVLNRLLSFVLAWAEPEYSLQLSIATILATMGNDSNDGYGASSASVPSEAPAYPRGRPRIERSRFVVDSSESSDSDSERADRAMRTDSPIETHIDLDDLLTISTGSLDLRALAVEAWSSSNCAKQLQMSGPGGIKVPPQPFKCPNSCFDSILVVLLSHIEEQLVQLHPSVALEVTRNHAHCKREVRHSLIQTPTQDWARNHWTKLCQFVPRLEQARFRATYISLTTVLVMLQHCPSPGSPSKRPENAECSHTFLAALNVPRVRERLAQISSRMMGIATSAAAAVMKSLRAITRRQNGNPLKHPPEETSLHPCLHFHRNNPATVQAGLTVTAARQACMSIPVPLVALLVKFGTSVSSWRKKVGVQLSKTRLTRLGVARDRFEIQIQNMIDAEAKLLESTVSRSPEGRRSKRKAPVSVSLWRSLFDHIRTHVLGNGTASDVAPIQHPLSARDGRIRRRRLRSNHPVIDRYLQAERGNDTFADLEEFIARDDESDEAVEGAIPPEEETEELAILLRERPLPARNAASERRSHRARQLVSVYGEQNNVTLNSVAHDISPSSSVVPTAAPDGVRVLQPRRKPTQPTPRRIALTAVLDDGDTPRVLEEEPRTKAIDGSQRMGGEATQSCNTGNERSVQENYEEDHGQDEGMVHQDKCAELSSTNEITVQIPKFTHGGLAASSPRT